jgi:hypothetical protein
MIRYANLIPDRGRTSHHATVNASADPRTILKRPWALDDGATAVVLFTDLANPTSNSLYQRLGYRPVEDRVSVEFKP